MASLTIVVDGVEQRFPLDSAAVTLGRGLESDIRLKDIKASRRHCQIVKTPRGYQCVDLSSGNGTYVNGVQIKSQMLDSGDKITVGSTTIAFEASTAPAKAPPPRPVSTKAATAKIPVAEAPEPAKIQAAAPTRKSTVKVQAVRASSQALKPVSQGALKPAGQPPSKSASRLGKPLAGTRGTRSARPPAPEPAKKKSPVLLIAIVLGVLALGGGGAWFFTRDGGDQTGAQIHQLMKKAEAAEKEEKFAAAAADYRKALELCQGERYKYQASDITRRLSQLDARKGGDASSKTDAPSKDAPEKGPDFQAKKAEIADKYKLSGDGAAADWGGALKEWSDIARGKAGDFKSKADAEIQAIQGRAKQDLDRLRKKAESLAQENKMAEALDLLKQQKPRFEHTDLQAELDAAIRQYDK
jgi:hypothetical protein